MPDDNRSQTKYSDKLISQVEEVKRDKIIIEELKEEPKRASPILPQGMPQMNPESMSKGVENLKNMNPDELERMTSMMKNMDPKFMENMLKAQGINMSAEQLTSMTNMMTPETIKMMTQMIGSGGFRMPEMQSQHSGQTQQNPDVTQQTGPPMPQVNADMVQNMLNNPAMTKMMSQMLSQQFGKNPENVETILNCLSKCMNFFMKFVSFYKFVSSGNRKYISGAAIVGLFSYWMGWVGN